MTSGGDIEAMRAAAQDAAREVLRELLPEILHEALATPAAGANGNGNGHHTEAAEPVPQVPAPPVAAVLRPSTWSSPTTPGEIVGENGSPRNQISHATSTPPPDDRAESVAIESDEDLNRFVLSLAKRLEDPRQRRAIRTGQIRFALRGGSTPAPAPASGPTLRVEKGAVTERTVRQAAAQGMRIVAARGAVITPLARDQARTLGVEIEKERTC